MRTPSRSAMVKGRVVVPPGGMTVGQVELQDAVVAAQHPQRLLYGLAGEPKLAAGHRAGTVQDERDVD
ncbi:MAG TPA: hypothetical protein VK911_15410 [Vicinamibacterales bacterium]|nr:hypothetical protein [Vicinamibacterales bacterium]